jgi:uncharacterized protein (TIGR02588 family)
MARASAKARQERKQEDPLKRRLETIAAIIGAVLAMATLGVIVWDGIRGSDAPATISVEAVNTHAHAGGYVLEIRAINNGDRTATGIVVEGELLDGEEVAATSTTTFDFVPARSRHQGALFFPVDPETHEIRLRAHGYSDP